MTISRRKKQRAARLPHRALSDPLPPFVKTPLSERLDVDTFVYLFEIFTTAASGKMPMYVSTKPVLHFGGAAIRLTDNPLNRGMVAALRELNSMGVSERTRLAYVWRITETNQLYDYVDRLANFVELSRDASVLTLSPALIKALAVVTYDVNEHATQINVEDLIVHAERFRDEEATVALRKANDPQLAPRTDAASS